MMAGFLIVKGKDQGKSFEIREGQTLIIGRAATCDVQLSDPYISRRHFQLEAFDDKIVLQNRSQNGTSVNQKKVDDVRIKVGDLIEIGETRIEFEIFNPGEDAIDERVFTANELRHFDFGDAAARLEILTTLPQIIADSRGDEDLISRLSDLLLKSIPDSNAVAAIIYDQTANPTREHSRDNLDESSTKSRSKATLAESFMIQSRTRNDCQFQASRRLIARSFEEGESVLHVWTKDSSDTVYTMAVDVDWAFCAPIQGEACQGWCFYVSGRLPPREVLLASQGDKTSSKLLGHVRFVELVAQFIGAVRHIQLLQDRQSTMQQFFSPRVIETLNNEKSEGALAPREGVVSVLVCDVRGFSRLVERSEGKLLEFLDQVGEALGAMTRAVMNHEGVIADFQGDSVLAFWGWPSQLEEGPLPACRAALEMFRQFLSAETSPDHPLHGFNVGIGIGYGRAIAGKIGTRQQAKVGVFGSVVNFASRLEGMTKQFGTPILLDQATAEFVGPRLDPTEASCRLVGRFQPLGMDQSVAVHQLLPAWIEEEAAGKVSAEEFDQAVQLFFEGQWTEALAIFAECPKQDCVARFLTDYAGSHNNVPPENWPGYISLGEK